MLKDALKPLLHYPVVPLLDRLHGRRTRVLTYHDVSPDTRDNFAQQCRWIRKHYNPVPLGEYVSAIESGRSLPPRSLVVTFDDGLLSVYRNGASILIDHGIPATLYVVPAFVERKLWLWWTVIEYALRETSADRLEIDLEGAGRLSYSFPDQASRHRTAGELNWRLHRRDNDRTLAWAQAIAAALGVTIPHEPPEEFASMTWDQLRELAGKGFTIGSHTLNHKILGTLADVASKRLELFESKRQIEAAMGAPCEHFCYPNGGIGDYSMVDLELIREAGYRSAVTTMIGMSYPKMDRYQIPRINAGAEVDNDFLRRKVAGAFFHSRLNFP